MFLVDQQITSSINASGLNISTVVEQVLEDLPVSVAIEASPFSSSQSWPIGSTRGQILEALAVAGDYFSPWFGNDGKFHMVRAFDPFTQVAQFDYDAGNQVIRQPIVDTDDLTTAPNRFVVVSNGSTDPTDAVFASADVPVTAPHSIPNRGFVIAQVEQLQIPDVIQATAVAKNLALRQTVFERVTLSTPPDPRHDSYDVIVWQGEKWLELSWSMNLIEGAAMTHLLRKAYT
jgi:hypothetical protein